MRRIPHAREADVSVDASAAGNGQLTSARPRIRSLRTCVCENRKLPLTPTVNEDSGTGLFCVYLSLLAETDR